MRFVSRALERSMVRGLHLVFVFATEGFSDRSVAEGLQLPMAGWVEFFPPNLSPSTRMLPHTEFAIPPEFLFCREPTRSSRCARKVGLVTRLRVRLGRRTLSFL